MAAGGRERRRRRGRRREGPPSGADDHFRRQLAHYDFLVLPPRDDTARRHAADASASNTCDGWDPNTDGTDDLYASTYSLRWPTDSSDPRGSPFTVGDVIPLDWLDDHKLDIQGRLAPNLATSPMATPDFRISPFLNDLPETFLRLKNANHRPLIASGSTPLGSSLAAFRTRYGAWSAEGSANDPDWDCSEKAVVLITDGDETCNGAPCSVADNLFIIDGVQATSWPWVTRPTPARRSPASRPAAERGRPGSGDEAGADRRARRHLRGRQGAVAAARP